LKDLLRNVNCQSWHFLRAKKLEPVIHRINTKHACVHNQSINQSPLHGFIWGDHEINYTQFISFSAALKDGPQIQSTTD